MVLKPSEKDPTAAIWMAELWAEAGLPAGVFNVLHGDKTAVDELLTHPDVKAVSASSAPPRSPSTSTQPAPPTASASRHSAARRTTPSSCPTPTSTSPPTPRSTPASAPPANAAWPSRALVAVGDIADELVAKITDRTDTLKHRRRHPGSDMGPLVTKVHRDKVACYIDAGEEAGATIVVDGRNVAGGRRRDGFLLGPTLIDHVTTDMSVYTDEIFGPVLSVVRVDSYDEALELVNSNPYGNGTAIFTNDGGAARRFQNEVEVGMVGINVPIPVPMAYYSFGGWKNSLFGDTHAHGTEGVHFFTRGKVVTTRWLDPSHGGLNLGFPQNN